MIDFLVIGGGIAGLSTAARLAPFGRTLVLEAEGALAYHATGRSAAMFEQNYGQASTIALNRASAAFHRSFQGGVLSDRGLMLVASRAENEAFVQDLLTMDLAEISAEEARLLIPVLDPDVLHRAAYHADAFDIDTHKLTEGFAREIRAHNGQIVTNARIQRAKHGPAGWQVLAGDVPYQAKLLINAAGAWADEVAATAGVARIGLQPYRRSMARIAAPAGHDVSGWPMVFGAAESWYAKPDAGALLVSPAEEDPVQPFDAWADDMVLAEGLARYEAMVTTPVERLLANWAGLRSFAPDRNLVIGFDPAQPAFFWVAGQGGYGIQSSPAASQFAADLILGRQSELDGPTRAQLDPARFS